MKIVGKPQAVIAVGRPCSVAKDFTQVQSPEKQLIYTSKTQSQAKIQTYMQSPYLQSPNYESRNPPQCSSKFLFIAHIAPASSPRKLGDSYQYKPKSTENQIYKPYQNENANSSSSFTNNAFRQTSSTELNFKQEPIKSITQDVLKPSNHDFKQINQDFNKQDFNRPINQDYNKPINQDIKPITYSNDTFRYEYTRTFADTFKSEKDANTERKSNTTKKDQHPFQESREHVKLGFDYLNRSPLCENNSRMAQNYGILQPKSRISTEITKISGTLRELLSAVQKNMSNGQLSDSMNDKMIEILSNFRKLEESANEPDNDSKIQLMTEDYNKLKAILEQLQTKMTALVQENQKLNKNLIEQEQKVNEEMRKKQSAEDKALQANKEFNRVFECLQINQRENEDLRIRLEKQEKDGVVCRQLFQQDEQFKELQKKHAQLLRDYESIESRLKQSEKKQIEMPKSPQLVRTLNNNKQSDNNEVKLLQLQIENDNLRAEVAHNQVDFKAIETKNEMIQKLDDKIKQLLKEKQSFEEQQVNLCHNLEQQLEQYKLNLQNKETDFSTLQKQKNEMERDLRSSITNYQTISKGQEDKLNQLKSDYQKLLEDYKQADSKKNKHLEDLRQSDRQLEQIQQEFNHSKLEQKKVLERNQILSHQLDQMNQQIQQQAQLQQSLAQQVDGYKQQESQLRQEMERMENSLKQKHNQLTDLNEQYGMVLRKAQEKERQVAELIDEMTAMKDQYEVQKKVCTDSVNEMERRSKNLKIQHEEMLAVKETEISDLKIAMDQQLKILDKRNALTNFDFEQREQQMQQDFQQKYEQLEMVKSELEKLRSTNYNLQEELLRAGMLITQNQATTNGLKNELAQQKQECQHLGEMLRKRKEEAEVLHQNLEEARKEQQTKKLTVDDSRRSMLRQQDLQMTIEGQQRENVQLQQKINSLQNELNRKQREMTDKNEEYQIMKRKFDETQMNLDRLEKRWADKIDQHRKN